MSKKSNTSTVTFYGKNFTYDGNHYYFRGPKGEYYEGTGEANARLWAANSYLSGAWWNELPYWNELPAEWQELIKSNPFKNGTNSYFWNTIFGGNKQENAMIENMREFDKWNADVYSQYLSYQNSLPSTQVSQQRTAGINPALSGGESLSGSTLQGPDTSGSAPLEDDSTGLEVFGQIISNVGQVVSSIYNGISTIVNAFNTVTDTKGKALDNVAKDFNNNILPERWQMEYRNFTENLKNMSLSRQLARNNEERAAFGFGANLRKQGYSLPNMKGSSSAVKSGYQSADKASKVEDYGRLYLANKYVSDPSFGVFFDTDFNPQPYIMDYINLNRSFMDLQARSRFIKQRAINAYDVYTRKYYETRNPVTLATSENTNDQWNINYKSVLDGQALAEMENARNAWQKMLDSYRTKMWKQYNGMLDVWYQRANSGDILATQMVGAIMGLSMPSPSAPWNYVGGLVQNGLTDTGNFLFPGLANLWNRVKDGAQSNYQDYINNPGTID